MTTRIYDVPDISCDHCRNAIEGGVGSLEAVEHVEVDIEARTVSVTGTADDAAIRDAIEEAGYSVASTS